MASEEVCRTRVCLCLYANLSVGMLLGVRHLSATMRNCTINCWIIQTLRLQTLPSPPKTHILRVTYLPEKRQNTHQTKLKKDLMLALFFFQSSGLVRTRPGQLGHFLCMFSNVFPNPYTQTVQIPASYLIWKAKIAWTMDLLLYHFSDGELSKGHGTPDLKARQSWWLIPVNPCVLHPGKVKFLLPGNLWIFGKLPWCQNWQYKLWRCSAQHMLDNWQILSSHITCINP